MKFDIAIMNPPFDRNLHLKILEHVIPVAEEVVNISPIRWLQDPLAKYKKNSDLNKFEDSIAKHIESLEEVDTKSANDMFNIGMLSNLGILKLTRNGGYNYINNKFYLKIFDKIKKENNYNKQQIKHYSDDLDNYVCANTMAPPMKYGKPMFYALKQIGVLTKNRTYREEKKTLKGATRGDVENTTCVTFNTINEAQHCYDAFNTTFAMYVCQLSVVGVNVHQGWLPWMSDYSKPWTNERFCEYFGITGFISDTEAEPNSEWEEILNTMKQYE